MNDELHQGSKDLINEFEFTTSRSSGPGGQNVNKVNSKVTLRWDVRNSTSLDEGQKEAITRKLFTKMTNEGVLLITSQESRSQAENKAQTILKLDLLLEKVFAPVRKRRPTKVGTAAKRKRLQNKKQHAEKKQWRKKPG